VSVAALLMCSQFTEIAAATLHYVVAYVKEIFLYICSGLLVDEVAIHWWTDMQILHTLRWLHHSNSNTD